MYHFRRKLAGFCGFSQTISCRTRGGWEQKFILLFPMREPVGQVPTKQLPDTARRWRMAPKSPHVTVVPDGVGDEAGVFRTLPRLIEAYRVAMLGKHEHGAAVEDHDRPRDGKDAAEDAMGHFRPVRDDGQTVFSRFDIPDQVFDRSVAVSADVLSK